MKTITIDEKLYAHIASQTKYIGESASDILRRLLMPETESQLEPDLASPTVTSSEREEKVETDAQTSEPLALDEGAILACSTIVERFLLVLSWLHNAKNERFSEVLSIKGKGRDYFATNKEHLLATGSSTNPKAIPGTDFWVVTNNNTSKKASILKLVAIALDYDEKMQNQITQMLTVK